MEDRNPEEKNLKLRNYLISIEQQIKISNDAVKQLRHEVNIDLPRVANKEIKKIHDEVVQLKLDVSKELRSLSADIEMIKIKLKIINTQAPKYQQLKNSTPRVESASSIVSIIGIVVMGLLLLLGMVAGVLYALKH